MDSNKVLIAFFVLIVAFLAFPIVMNKTRGQQTNVQVAGAPASETTATPAPATTSSSDDAKYNQPPLLNEQNLINSNWQFDFQNYKVKLTFSAGGVCYATHPMAKVLTGIDYIEGRWRISGNRVFLTAGAGGNDISQEFVISGDKLFQVKEGKPRGELLRY